MRAWELTGLRKRVETGIFFTVPVSHLLYLFPYSSLLPFALSFSANELNWTVFALCETFVSRLTFGQTLQRHLTFCSVSNLIKTIQLALPPPSSSFFWPSSDWQWSLDLSVSSCCHFWFVCQRICQNPQLKARNSIFAAKSEPFLPLSTLYMYVCIQPYKKYIFCYFINWLAQRKYQRQKKSAAKISWQRQRNAMKRFVFGVCGILYIFV